MAAIEENAFTDVGDEAQRRRADKPDWSQPSTLRIGVDFNMEKDVVVDEVCAGEAEKFAEATVAAVVGTVEIELAVAGEAPASHPAFGGAAFDDDELLDMEGHTVGRFGEGAEDADEGEAGFGTRPSGARKVPRP